MLLSWGVSVPTTLCWPSLKRAWGASFSCIQLVPGVCAAVFVAYQDLVGMLYSDYYNRYTTQRGVIVTPKYISKTGCCKGALPGGFARRSPLQQALPTASSFPPNTRVFLWSGIDITVFGWQHPPNKPRTYLFCYYALSCPQPRPHRLRNN